MDLNQIEYLIKEDRRRAALLLLSAIDLKTLENQHRCQVAKLWRLYGCPTTGIKSLHPIIRKDPSNNHGSVEEIEEYSQCLLELGAYEETKNLLLQERSDWTRNRECLLGKVYFELLDFDSAKSRFEKYLESETDLVETRNAQRLLIRCYRILGNFDRAMDLASKHPEFKHELELTNLITRSFHETNSQYWLEKLKVQRIHFEIGNQHSLVRELDFYISMLTKDMDLINRLFYGSDSNAFRDRIRQASSTPIQFQQSYIWGMEHTKAPERVFDLLKGIEHSNSKVFLKIGQSVHRLLIALLSDFYTSFSIARVSYIVFEGENFDPNSAPMRIHQLIKRLKEWFIENEIPLEIKEKKGSYQLMRNGEYGFLIEKQLLDFWRKPVLYARLEVLLPKSQFNIRMAANALGLSPRFTRKILLNAQKNGWIQKNQKGTRTVYSFKE